MLTGDSLWGRWIKSNLLKKKCFWEVKDDTQAGSWMWTKIIKIRDIAKNFYKKEVGNGCNTSFWYDNWSSEGVLVDTLGTRGPIVLGIRMKLLWQKLRLVCVEEGIVMSCLML